MIEYMKSNLMQRNYPLTLIFGKKLSIQSVLRIKRILENDNSLNSKLKFEFEDVETKEDLKGAISEINHDQHPILNKYISLLVNNQ